MELKRGTARRAALLPAACFRAATFATTCIRRLPAVSLAFAAEDEVEDEPLIVASSDGLRLLPAPLRNKLSAATRGPRRRVPPPLLPVVLLSLGAVAAAAAAAADDDDEESAEEEDDDDDDEEDEEEENPSSTRRPVASSDITAWLPPCSRIWSFSSRITVLRWRRAFARLALLPVRLSSALVAAVAPSPPLPLPSSALSSSASSSTSHASSSQAWRWAP